MHSTGFIAQAKMFVAAMLASLLMLSGCATAAEKGPSAAPTASAAPSGSLTVSGNGYPLTVQDYLGRPISLATKPTRIAVISGTLMNIWYDVGGESVCAADISENLRIPPEQAARMRAVPSVGPAYGINIEAVVAQKPDLVITQAGTQNTQAQQLERMGIPVITARVRSYDDLVAAYRVFGVLLGHQERADQRISEFAAGQAALVAKMPATPRKVAILYVTSKSLAVKLDNSIAGNMASTLGIQNIASGSPPDSVGSETTPLDIEEIVRRKPDVVLVTSMISDNEQAKATMAREFANNPAWKAVEAVNENRVQYLPQQYFLFHPGPYYVDALTYLAQATYPELLGAPQQIP